MFSSVQLKPKQNIALAREVHVLSKYRNGTVCITRKRRQLNKYLIKDPKGGSYDMRRGPHSLKVCMGKISQKNSLATLANGVADLLKKRNAGCDLHSG